MIGGQTIRELVENEIIERQQEGCVVPDYSDRLRTADSKELEKVYKELEELTVSEDFPYEEPEKLDEILAASTGCEYKAVPDKDKLFDMFYGAWLGRIVGCILGKPHETYPFGSGDSERDGWECIKEWQIGAGGKFPPTDYISGKSDATEKFGYNVSCPDSRKENIKFAESDDDIRYLVLGLLINEKYGNSFTANDVADMWHRYLTKSMVFTAEFAAMRNSYICELEDPGERVEFCRSYHNPYREWIGAQIRIDHYGYYNAGDPLSAAKAAYHDASFSHTKNGAYGAMFFAALIAAAFTEKDIRHCVELALGVIPKKSRLYEDILFAVKTADESKNEKEIYKKLWDRFRILHPVHTNNNAAVCVASIIFGKGDFVKSVSTAIGAGWDTDCNGATVGSFMGALLGSDAIPEYLSKPLNDTLYSSIIDFHPASIKNCAERTYKLFIQKDNIE